MNNAAGLIIALTVLGAGGYLLFKKKEEDGPSFAANTPNVILNPSGSGTQYATGNNTTTPPPPPTVNPQIMAIVTQLRNGVTTWFAGSSRCEAYKKYYETNTNNFLLIWNLYKNQYGTTIREDMDATYESGCTIFGTQWDEKLYQRFDALGM